MKAYLQHSCCWFRYTLSFIDEVYPVIWYSGRAVDVSEVNVASTFWFELCVVRER
jgi:hypothetical protein